MISFKKSYKGTTKIGHTQVHTHFSDKKTFFEAKYLDNWEKSSIFASDLRKF